MILDIDLKFYDKIDLYLSPSNKNNAWSYFNVYSLRDFKDIYNVYYHNESVRSITKLFDYCKNVGIESETGKVWTERNLLEIVNALKKTGLLDSKSSSPLSGNIFHSAYNQDLTISDKDSLKSVFFSYFRFVDFLRIFKTSSTHDDIFVIAYMDGCRFFNRFIDIKNKIVYCLEDDKKNVMRFWDVFTKWGMTLHLINKCSLNALNIDSCTDEVQKGYLLNLATPLPSQFSILKFMEDNFSTECVYIPDLERELILRFRYHIEEIKAALINECIKNSLKYRLQRITEIFIESGERTLFPFVDGTYMSHILKL